SPHRIGFAVGRGLSGDHVCLRARPFSKNALAAWPGAPNLENNSFPIAGRPIRPRARAETAMTEHPGVLTIDRPLDARESSRFIKGLGGLEGRMAGPTDAAAPAPTVPGGGEGALGGPGHALQARIGLKSQLRAVLLAGVSLLAIASSGYFGWHYWTAGRFQVSTDNAYVKADTITIAPKVSGYIGSVLVGDNEAVHAGQVLARIDDRDFRVALQQADADVVASHAAS